MTRNTIKCYLLASLLVATGVAANAQTQAVKSHTAPHKRAAVAKASGHFLLMSDIHFDPFSNPEIVPQLVSTDISGWRSLFESSGNNSYGAYHSDTYFELFKSGLEAMRAANNKPDMIIINGDFLCHSFLNQFNASGLPTNDSIDPFIRKTAAFVFSMINEYFPNTPVLPVLGNNDSYCGDYAVQCPGPFLNFFASECIPALHDMKRYDFTGTFQKGGYYKVVMPWDTSEVFIGLNTIPFSPKYQNGCDANFQTDPNAGWDEFSWLRSTLAACASGGKKVWLSYHIPPGMDIYASIKYGATGMWGGAYNDSFIALMNQYSNIIKANFAGHTHMDEFRLVCNNSSQAVSFVHVTPAISPVFGNDPAFQEVAWDPKLMELRDIVTYKFKGFDIFGNNKWSPEYDFDTTYNVPGIDAKVMVPPPQ